MKKQCDYRTKTNKCRRRHDALIPKHYCDMCINFTTMIQTELMRNDTIIMVQDDGEVWQLADPDTLKQLRR